MAALGSSADKDYGRGGGLPSDNTIFFLCGVPVLRGIELD